MASARTNFTVGIFVLTGLVIGIISIIWFGMSHYFEEGQQCVAYFDESVQGLSKDSPVKYRGVSIGRVTNIKVAPDLTLIEVILLIESDIKQFDNIVAQLKSVGITGIMFIELDKKKPNEPNLSPKINFPSPYPAIATKPSDIKQFVEGIDDLIKQLSKLNVTTIADNLNESLKIITQTVKEAQIKEIASDIRMVMSDISGVMNKAKAVLSVKKLDRIIDSIDKTSSNLNQLTRDSRDFLKRLDNVITSNEKDLSKSIKDFQSSLNNVNKLLENGSTLIENTDQRIVNLQRHLITTSINFEKVSENLNRMIEVLAERPSRLIFSDDPEPKQIE